MNPTIKPAGAILCCIWSLLGILILVSWPAVNAKSYGYAFVTGDMVHIEAVETRSVPTWTVAKGRVQNDSQYYLKEEP